jgi:crotonobetainyl-CoA:carnitine CoA-transferase CaiB-like acyl-CoA transferase
MYRLPLFDHRVIDLTDGHAGLAGRLLGDMGAEVIKVEAPGGDSLRGSDVFDALNANKYSCVIDPEAEPALVLKLAGLADIVIGPAGRINAGAMRDANDGLIVVVVPPEAGPMSAVAAAGATGLALWDRRRTGYGGVIEVAGAAEEEMEAGRPAAAAEPVSGLDGLKQVPALPWLFSDTPAHVRLPAPRLGEHDAYVRGLLLGEAPA